MNECLVIDLIKYKKTKLQKLEQASIYVPKNPIHNNQELKRKQISNKLEKLINKIKISIINLEQRLNNQDKH